MIERTKFYGKKKEVRQQFTSENVFEVVLSNCVKNPKQKEFIDCNQKRIIVRAGRRGGKTYGISQKAIKRFLAPTMNRILYAAPTADQVEAFWFHVVNTLDPLIRAKKLYKNETEHIIEVPGTKQRIRAKTAWNADTLRGDYADCLILDEWQLMNEDAWELVGAPMLLDNNGDAIFIYTPISLHSGKKFVSKANDPQHAAKMFKRAAEDIKKNGNTSRWATFHWKSKENGYISSEAVEELAQDMTNLAYRQEIEAEDIDEAPGAMWTRAMLDHCRLPESLRLDRERLPLDRIVVAIDPSGSTTGDEAGIVIAGRNRYDVYILEDRSLQGRPESWGQAAVNAYKDYQADKIVAEQNYGGLMVETTIKMVDGSVPVKLVNATRGKAIRAEPVSAIYEKGRAHHVGIFAKMENEMCLWQPGMKSPNRMDALVWAITELCLGPGFGLFELWRKDAEDKEKTVEQQQQEEDVALQVGQAQKAGIREFEIRTPQPTRRELKKLGPPKSRESKRCPGCNSVVAEYQDAWKCNICGQGGAVVGTRTVNVLHPDVGTP